MGRIRKDGSKKDNLYCSAYGCNSYRGTEGVNSCHYFPKESAGTVKRRNKLGIEEDIDLQLAWKLKLKMGKNVSEHMRICSLLFSKSCYIPIRGPTLAKVNIP